MTVDWIVAGVDRHPLLAFVALLAVVSVLIPAGGWLAGWLVEREERRRRVAEGRL